MNLTSWIITLLVFLSLSSAGVYSFNLYESIWQREQTFLLSEITESQASAIERRLARSLSATYMLAHQVRQAKGDFEGFDEFAEEIINAVGGISNLQLAPGGIIRKIYPLAGNEAALGHNLLVDDQRNREAYLAIQEKRLTLAGPFELIQGGTAVIGRNPVFLEQGRNSQFWGFASALIFLDDLLAVTDLHDLETKGYQFELARINPGSGERDVFAHSQAPLGEFKTDFSITVPNAQWHLTLSKPLPDRPLSVWQGFVISILFAVLVALLLAHILKEPVRLKKIVAEKTEQLNELAFYDVLTGLVNRRLFMQQLEYELHILQRTGKKAALLYLDLDDFKKVNDTLGHEAGDQLLVSVAERIKSSVRASDIVCRLGGDEYAVLLMNIRNMENAGCIAEAMLQKMVSDCPLNIQGVQCSLSIGITMIPNDSGQLRDVLNSADLALYESKRRGKNCYTFFDQSMQQRAIERLSIEQELRAALQNNELELYFQPIVLLSNRQVTMIEALLRWNHPEKGMISPALFMDVAEQCSLIIPIGNWVLEQACARIRQSLDSGEPVVPIAVNISAKQLIDPQFANNVRAVFKRYEIDPWMIEMEITETSLMENMEMAVKQLNLLKNSGCRISIDDFGTGYSSLAQLKKLPVNTLKVDRSFVRDIEYDHHDRQIVEAIIAMAHRMGLSVIAEGVENQAQLDFIDAAGCDMVQGFLFSKPVPYSEVDLHELVI